MVRQDDAGDCFYVILSGTADVHVRGAASVVEETASAIEEEFGDEGAAAEAKIAEKNPDAGVGAAGGEAEERSEATEKCTKTARTGLVEDEKGTAEKAASDLLERFTVLYGPV